MDNVIGNESPRTALISWAKGQDKWVQQLVYLVSTSRCPPTEQELQQVYSTLLQEKELAEGTGGLGATEFSLSTTDGENIPFALLDLVHIGGVNRLLPNQKLEFNPRFTVIYGENGVGKTGYVRILKKLAGVRNAEDVLPDVNSEQAASGARATVKYRSSAEEYSVNWSHESNVSPFNRMAIFDARCAALHVDSELSFHYTPKELSLFKFVHDGLEPIRGLLEKESRERAQRENNLLPRFSRGTRTYLAIETLGASTDLTQLESWALSFPPKSDPL
ncbi:MAG: hypothetical protein QY326_06465 [Bdellovibrionota bacterium]|nr:MAG: hypothetical protein QY326_06465 [Bdellovibrionota bacterium]